MKTKILLTGAFLVLFGFSYAQERQSNVKTSYKSIIPDDKQNLLRNIDMYANTQLAFRNDFTDGEFLGSKFKFEQFRMEIKGYIHKNIYFRFRHRFTSPFEPQSIDKIIKGVDFAYLVFKLSDKWKLTFGKTYADWGGMEFDLNPIDIYEYSDIIEMADNFLPGAEVHFKASESNNFGLQILNSRTGSFEDIYDTIPDVVSSKVPLAIVFNWRGSFWDGKFSTIWSYSYFTEAKNNGKNYIALGNQFRSKHFDIAYDFKISQEDIDRTGIISNEIPDSLYNYAVKNTLYQSHWIRATYKFNKKWHLSLDAFVDFADWKDDLDPLKTEDRFRTTYSFIPTIEFFPYEDFNLKFFVGYVGRYFKYSDYVKSRPGLHFKDYDTGRIMIGVISPLKFL
jgi:hypothetical protein